MFAKSLLCQGHDRHAKGENEREKAKASMFLSDFFWGLPVLSQHERMKPSLSL